MKRNPWSLPHSMLSVFRGAAVVTLFGVALGGCGGGPAKAANPTRSLDERRAVQIIAQAFHDEHDRPVPGRGVPIADGKELEVDVMSEGHKYGIAYVTANERLALGSAIPPRPKEMGDALQLVHGSGEDADTKVLLLHDTEYVYDDQVGTGHEETTITAERKLARDVRDFLVRAHAERWP